MCMVDSADEWWDIFEDKTRVARKAHKCCECNSTIQPRDQYYYAKGFMRGYGWSDYHMCMPCRESASWLIKQCGGFLFHGVYEDLREHWEEGPFGLGMTDAEFIGLGREIITMRRRIAASRTLAAA